MFDFITENGYFFAGLLTSTAISWGLAIFFVSKKTLGLFFGAWYLTLALFLLLPESYANASFPELFIITHLAVIFILSKVFSSPFSWKNYIIFSVASFIFGGFAMISVLEAALEIIGHK